jgi:asparagine synthetase B (glutamine-hydrolysing)
MLHYAAQASATPLQTFSITFERHSFDEAAYIREVARATAPSIMSWT